METLTGPRNAPVCACGHGRVSHDAVTLLGVGWQGHACRATFCGCMDYAPAPEPRHETVRLFEPAPNVIPGQLGL